MTTGLEVVVQQLLHLDDEFIVLRGRTAGTNDSGRIVILPYGQLVSVAFNRALTADEIQAIFGIAGFEPTPSSAGNGDGFELSAEGAARPAADALPPALLPAATGDPAKPLSKTILLKRLRERLAGR